MTGGESDTVLKGGGRDDSDVLSMAFYDRAQQIFGLARIGLLPNQSKATAMALIFEGDEVVAGQVEGGIDSNIESWSAVSVAGLELETRVPHRRWSASCSSEGASFNLEFTALGPSLCFDDDPTIVEAGSIAHHTKGCKVTGAVAIGDRKLGIDGYGDRTRGWGSTDWPNVDSTRALCAVFDDGQTFCLHSVRSTGATGHDSDLVRAQLAGPGEASEQTIAFDPALLSVGYDSEGRQHTVGCELHEPDDEYPRRLSGKVICGTSIDLGALKLNLSFFDLSFEGQPGTGRFDILKRKGNT